MPTSSHSGKSSINAKLPWKRLHICLCWNHNHHEASNNTLHSDLGYWETNCGDLHWAQYIQYSTENEYRIKSKVLGNTIPIQSRSLNKLMTLSAGYKCFFFECMLHLLGLKLIKKLPFTWSRFEVMIGTDKMKFLQKKSWAQNSMTLPWNTFATATISPEFALQPSTYSHIRVNKSGNFAKRQKHIIFVDKYGETPPPMQYW